MTVLDRKLSPSHEWRLINHARRAIPVDVHAVADALSVPVHEAFLDPEISGMLEKVGPTYRISVNHTHAITRKRFTIAHELGHYMLHRELIGQGLDDDRAYRSTSAGKYHNTLIGPREETEANHFAANLLMPVDAVRDAFARDGDVDAVAGLFQVSPQAMAIRLGVTYTR